MRICLLFIYILLAYNAPFAQTREVPAVKAPLPPRIDGQLDDKAWENAPVINDFVQNYPVFRGQLSNRTAVRLVYDNNAIYIGAFLQDERALIRKQLTARDGEQQQDVDYFAVFFDTYNDQQNGFQFLVTSANVQTDAKVTPSSSGNFGNFGDKTWDAVWQSQTRITDSGWIVEMRIPYISLRFAQKEVQTWGLQLLRFSRRNNETAFWNAVDPNVNGFVNQFGKLTGIRNIQPPLRLSLSPYISTGIRMQPKSTGIKDDWLRSGGMDVKWGINESFTLDATLIPDFGQVVSDNVVNNLSPFEQRFQENRPFFTEGTELFNKAGLFYSRRIGARPGGYGRINSLYGNSSLYEIKENPSITQLYNAVKLSGRTRKKLGIGTFNAVTAPMYATLYNPQAKADTQVNTEPLANYNIVVLDQAFKGRTSVTFTNANVIRNGAARDANVSALDWALFNSGNTHALTGTLRYSKIFGYTPYSGAYFMNTDTVTIGSRRYLNPYDGFASTLRFAKVGGAIRFNTQVSMESDKYDPNDLGYLQSANRVNYTGSVSYNQFRPTKNFLNYNYSFNIRRNYLFRPYQFSLMEVGVTGFWLFRNFWDVRLSAAVQPTGEHSFFELQTKGYQLHKPWFYFASLSGSTDSRKRLYVEYEFVFAEGAKVYKPYYKTQLGARYRFSEKLTLSLEMDRQIDPLQIGYAFRRESNGAPIVGYRNYRDVSTVFSGTYNFTSRMNLTLRSRHYWSKVHYLSFHNVDDKGRQTERPFIEDQDQNFNLFNTDAFFTWDFRPGSRIIAGWKNWLGNEDIDGLKNRNYFRNFNQVFNIDHGNEISLRIIYFLDYNQLRKRTL